MRTGNGESFVVDNSSLRNYFLFDFKLMELLNVRFACEVFIKNDNIADTE